MTDHAHRAQPELGDQGAQLSSHGGQRQAVTRRTLGKSMTGQIRRNHGESFGQQRCQAAPGVSGSAGAVNQQKRRPRTHLLNMPTQSAGLMETAAFSVRPAAGFDRPVERLRCGSQIHSALAGHAAIVHAGLPDQALVT